MDTLNIKHNETQKEITHMENRTMTNIFKVTVLACLMAAASNAVAGPNANVSIKDTLTMGACTPILNSDDNVDCRNIRTDTLSAPKVDAGIDESTQLGGHWPQLGLGETAVEKNIGVAVIVINYTQTTINSDSEV